MDTISSIDEAIARIYHLLEETEGRVLIGLVGAPGAGKSTLGAQLKDAFADIPTALVPMDGYHLSNAELTRLGRIDRKGAPDTFDSFGFFALLKRINDSSETVYFPVFHREIEESIAAEGVVSVETRLVIIEGNYLLMESDGWSGIKSLLTESWFIDLPTRVRHERLIARHIEYGKEPVSAQHWALGSDEANASIIEATRHRADLRITFNE